MTLDRDYEASTIPDVIWETASGALTDEKTQIIWFVAGNPTRSTGMFRECFESQAHRWRTVAVDARTVSITNKAQQQEWIDDWGIDSDWVRVRVLGKFPRVGTLEFISRELATGATLREVETHPHDPLVFGVDVARFGDDASVIYIRKGRDGRSHPPKLFRGVDTMTLAGHVADLALAMRPDAVFVDGTGVGGGVVDRLRQLRINCIDVQFGAKADRLGLEGDHANYANKRAEMWGYMRQWLTGGAITLDETFVKELSGPEYSFNGQDQILLEKKESVKKRFDGVSPDRADALALTFAYPVMPNAFAGRDYAAPLAAVSEYDPLARQFMDA